MKKTEQSRTIAAIYKRLSDDDDQDGTSVSIETQGKILTDYCNTHGFLVYDHYSDDGYTGTNFVEVRERYLFCRGCYLTSF